MSGRFTRLLEPVLPDLRRWSAAVVRDRAEAEDVLQEALMKAYRDFTRYSEGTSFRAFVFTYAAHEALNRNRAALRRREREAPVDVAAVEEPAAFMAFEEMLHDEVLRDPRSVLAACGDEVRAAFLEMRVVDQVIFLLRSVGGLSCREVSSALEVPLGTVLGTLYRVRVRLRRRLLHVAKERGLVARKDER